MDELVSIVVTSYNHVEFLQQRMDSLLTQTYQNTEIIVVDDCSTDGSREFFKDYETNPKVRLFQLDKNNGYVFASNFGVSQAKGDYIVFAECDDFAEPEQIQVLFEEISKRQNVGVVFSCCKLVDDMNNVIGSNFDWRTSLFKKFCQTDILIPKIQMQKFLGCANVVQNMSAAMFKKTLFNKIGGLSDKYELCSDWDLWVRIANVSDFYYLTKSYNNYRFHLNSFRNQIGISIQLTETIIIVENLIKEINVSFSEKIYIKYNLLRVFLGHAIKGDISFSKQFFIYWLRSLRREPYLLIAYLLNAFVLSIRRTRKLPIV